MPLNSSIRKLDAKARSYEKKHALELAKYCGKWLKLLEQKNEPELIYEDIVRLSANLKSIRESLLCSTQLDIVHDVRKALEEKGNRMYCQYSTLSNYISRLENHPGFAKEAIGGEMPQAAILKSYISFSKKRLEEKYGID